MNGISISFPYNTLTECPESTEDVGKALAELIINDPSLPRFVAMYGDLGVGKTAFVRGFCSLLCPGVTVKSPTFALVNEYRCSDRREKKVCHFDMYRISGEDDLYSIGFYDYLDARNICIAEWCELIPFALPESYIKVEIKKVDLENKRNIFIGLV
jgi:tRNA threonylcarbamoyladenosine biosynthesis protein TsaE